VDELAQPSRSTLFFNPLAGRELPGVTADRNLPHGKGDWFRGEGAPQDEVDELEAVCRWRMLSTLWLLAGLRFVPRSIAPESQRGIPSAFMYVSSSSLLVALLVSSSVMVNAVSDGNWLGVQEILTK